MLTPETVRTLALSLPETDEHDHWGRPAFRVKKKIFATVWPAEQRAVLKLPLAEQARLAALDPVTFAPVPNKWGAQGWTGVQFDNLDEEEFLKILKTSWRTTAPPKLAGQL